MKSRLSQKATAHGYSSELCNFLETLEYNLQLIGAGEQNVVDAIEEELPEYSVVKIALANIDKACEEDYDKPIIMDWEKKGEEEFKKHCTSAGRFKYSDFKRDRSWRKM